MKTSDFMKALGVAVATLVITLVASFPMVAVYAWLIEPGHPPEFYTDAAQWIAPWSSHVLGPLVFFAFNFWLARRNAERNAVLFAVATVVLYVVVDFSMLPLMGLDLFAALSLTMGASLGAKLVGALLGAHLGTRRRPQATAALP
jgi:hypothetical protein